MRGQPPPFPRLRQLRRAPRLQLLQLVCGRRRPAGGQNWAVSVSGDDGSDQKQSRHEEREGHEAHARQAPCPSCSSRPSCSSCVFLSKLLARERPISRGGDRLSVPLQAPKLLEIHVAAAEHANDPRACRRLDSPAAARQPAPRPRLRARAWRGASSRRRRRRSARRAASRSRRRTRRTISNVFSPTRFTRRPSMMQSTRSSVTSPPRLDAALHARRAGRLDADHADLRVGRFMRHGHARNQPAAADRHDDDVDVGPVAEDLEANCPLPHDELHVVERMDVGVAAFGDQLLRASRSLRPRCCRAARRRRRSRASPRPWTAWRWPPCRRRRECRGSSPRARRPARGCRPRSRSRRGASFIGVRNVNLLSGPRILYDPVRWKSSALSRTSNPCAR